MKKLFLAFMLTICAALSLGQVKAQSYEVGFKDSGVGVTYINDGYDGAAGIVLKDLGFKNVFGVKGLNASTLIVNTRTDASRSYVGGLFNYDLVDKGAFKLNVGVGAKGLDISSLINNGGLNGFNFNAPRQFVWSVGVTIPYRS